DGDRQAQGGSRSLETMRQGHLRNQVGTSMSSRYGPARSLARARVVPNMAGASRTEKQVLCREALGAQKRRWKRGRLVAYYKLLRMSAIALTRFSPAQRPRPADRTRSRRPTPARTATRLRPCASRDA